MNFEISFIHDIGNTIVVYADVENYYSSWDPQDEYWCMEPCVTTISRNVYDCISPDPSTEEIKTLLNSIDPVWSPI